MKCPECGSNIGHAPWCPLNPQSISPPSKPLGSTLPDYKKYDDYPTGMGNFNKKGKCPHCDGTGHIRGEPGMTCWKCNGLGEI